MDIKSNKILTLQYFRAKTHHYSKYLFAGCAEFLGVASKFDDPVAGAHS